MLIRNMVSGGKQSKQKLGQYSEVLTKALWAKTLTSIFKLEATCNVFSQIQLQDSFALEEMILADCFCFLLAIFWTDFFGVMSYETPFQYNKSLF